MFQLRDLSVQNVLVAFGLSAVFLILLDAIVLSLLQNFFNKQIMSIQGSAIAMDPYAAILCYILLVSGLVYFIVLQGRPLLDAFLLGLFVYGVYETTSKSLLKRWNWTTVMVDSLWGGTLFALTTGGVYAVLGRRIELY